MLSSLSHCPVCLAAQSKGMDLMGVREGRYDAVFHLVTAAFGAEAYYTLANNPDSRTETLEEAREVGTVSHMAKKR